MSGQAPQDYADGRANAGPCELTGVADGPAEAGRYELPDESYVGAGFSRPATCTP